MSKKILFKKRSGTVLLMTLLILSSILIVTLGAASLIVPGIVMNRNQMNSIIAYFAAEAGAERALWQAYENFYVLPNVNTNNIFTSNLTNGSSYIVNYATSTPIVSFTSIGSFRSLRRLIQTSFQTQ